MAREKVDHPIAARLIEKAMLERGQGSDERQESGGTNEAWPTLVGAGKFDDNVLELADVTYRAISLQDWPAMSGSIIQFGCSPARALELLVGHIAGERVGGAQ